MHDVPITVFFDICDHATPLPKADIVIAADIMYEPMTGIAAALRTVEALKVGSRVIIGCSPGRPGRPLYSKKLKELLPGVDANFKDVEGRSCSGSSSNIALLDLKPEDCDSNMDPNLIRRCVKAGP